MCVYIYICVCVCVCVCVTFMWLREKFTFGHCEQGNKNSVCTREEKFLIIWATTKCSVQCKLISGLKTFQHNNAY